MNKTASIHSKVSALSTYYALDMQDTIENQANMALAVMGLLVQQEHLFFFDQSPLQGDHGL